jgi:DnaJ-class molecular chaperone
MSWQKCPVCNGEGKLSFLEPVTGKDSRGYLHSLRPCTSCKGTGLISEATGTAPMTGEEYFKSKWNEGQKLSTEVIETTTLTFTVSDKATIVNGSHDARYYNDRCPLTGKLERKVIQGRRGSISFTNRLEAYKHAIDLFNTNNGIILNISIL